jgi:hypothetical protein
MVVYDWSGQVKVKSGDMVTYFVLYGFSFCTLWASFINCEGIYLSFDNVSIKHTITSCFYNSLKWQVL